MSDTAKWPCGQKIAVYLNNQNLINSVSKSNTNNKHKQVVQMFKISRQIFDWSIKRHQKI